MRIRKEIHSLESFETLVQVIPIGRQGVFTPADSLSFFLKWECCFLRLSEFLSSIQRLSLKNFWSSPRRRSAFSRTFPPPPQVL